MITALLVIALVWAITKWIFWRINFLAISLRSRKHGAQKRHVEKKAWDKKITQILWIIFLSMIVSIMVVRLTRG